MPHSILPAVRCPHQPRFAFRESRLLAVAERPVRGSRPHFPLPFLNRSAEVASACRTRIVPAALVLCDNNRHNHILGSGRTYRTSDWPFHRLNHFYSQRCKMKLVIAGMPMSKWDRRFCKLAKFVSEWIQKDPSAKVERVLYSRRGGDITIGYNGLPVGVEGSCQSA